MFGVSWRLNFPLFLHEKNAENKFHFPSRERYSSSFQRYKFDLHISTSFHEQFRSIKCVFYPSFSTFTVS